MIDDPLPRLALRPCAAFNGDARDRGDRRQRLTPEAKSGDPFDGLVRKLGGRVPLQRQRDLVGAHPAAIVGHLDQREPALGETDRNLAGACVNRVLDQFLERAGGTLHHLTRRDAVDEVFGEAPDGANGLGHDAAHTSGEHTFFRDGPPDLSRKSLHKILGFARCAC